MKRRRQAGAFRMKADAIYLRQHTRFPNFGDLIGTYLLEKLWPGSVVIADESIIGRRNLLICGSTIQRADPWSIICGAGAKRPNSVPLFVRTVWATRGPLSDAALRSGGLPQGEINGDPGYLLPTFFRPDVPITNEIGAVIHYAEATGAMKRALSSEGIRFIDVLRPVEDVASEIMSCEIIISSSLHGLIVADAYGKPTAWLRLGDRIDGGDFKFCDYLQSQGLSSNWMQPASGFDCFRVAAKAAYLKPRGIDTEAMLTRLNWAIAEACA